MSDLLKKVIANKEDLYELLNFTQCMDVNFPLESINEVDIKRKYRSMVLKYHPDKNLNMDEHLVDRFHKLSIANEILSNPTLRSSYDHWYTNYRILQASLKDKNDKRSQLINNLEQAENKTKQSKPREIDLHALQKNGEQLRKLKQFNLSYGNWNGNLPHIDKESSLQAEHESEWPDSSDLRFHIERNIPINNEENVVPILMDILQLTAEQILGYHDAGNTNKFPPNVSILHIMFTHPRIALNIFKKWENGAVSYTHLTLPTN